MTPEAWWKLLNSNWDDLLGLINRFHPKAKAPKEPEHAISAQKAELERHGAVLDIIANDTSTVLIGTRALTAKAEHNMRLMYQILTDTWFGIPESRELINSLNGFDALCTLCEECVC